MTYIRFDSVHFEAKLLEAKAKGETAVRLDVTNAPCPFCGAMANTQDAAFATGLEIVHYDVDVVKDPEAPNGYRLEQGPELFRYTPGFGEVIKNHYMRCMACNEDQAS